MTPPVFSRSVRGGLLAALVASTALAATPTLAAETLPNTRVGLEKAAHEAGKLIVKGKTPRARQTVVIEGTSVTSSPKKAFTVRKALVLGDCLVSIRIGNKTDNVKVSACGPVGPTGAKGPTGARGPVGAAGPAGSVGAMGPAGAAGAAGSAGVAGPTGATGATGATGPTGPTGIGSVLPIIGNFNETPEFDLDAGSLPLDTYAFVSETATVTLAVGSRLVASASTAAKVDLNDGFGEPWEDAADQTEVIAFAVCLQPTAGGSVQPFIPDGHTYFSIEPEQLSAIAVNGTALVAAGTYNVGLCVGQIGAAVNNRLEFDYASGWVMTINP